MTAKEILIEELNEEEYIESVSDVIFWALEEYSKRTTRTNGSVVANYIVDRIKEEEKG